MVGRTLLASFLVLAGAPFALGQGASTRFAGALNVIEGPGGASFGGITISTQEAVANGGVVVAGNLWGDATNFNLSGASTPIDTVGKHLFVARYARDGGLRWVRTFAGNEYSSVTSLAVASNGDLLLGGLYGGSEVVETPSGPAVLSSTDQLRGFLIRLRGDGTPIAARIVGPYVYGAHFDRDDNLYYWGASYGQVDLDPGPGVDLVEMGNSLGSTYVVKLGPNGDYRWGFAMGTDAPAIIFAMTVAPSGDLYMSGLLYRASFDFDFGRRTRILNSTYDSGFVMKRTSSGRLAWVELIEALPDPDGVAGGRVEARSIAYDDENDRVIVGGQFFGTVDFDPGRGARVFTSTAGPFVFDVFVSSWNARNGRENWTRVVNAGYVNDLAVGPDGRIAITGPTYDGAADMDPGAPGGEVTGSTYLATYLANGTLRWAGALNSTGPSYQGSLAFNGQGALSYSASLFGATDIDPTAGVITISDPNGRGYSGLGLLRVP